MKTAFVLVKCNRGREHEIDTALRELPFITSICQTWSAYWPGGAEAVVGVHRHDAHAVETTCD